MRINAKTLKQEQTDVVDAGTVAFTGTEIGIEGGGIEATITDHILEKMIASSKEPEKRIKVGSSLEFMIMVCSSDQELLALMLNEVVSTKTILTKSTITPKVLDLHAITFQTDLPDNPDSNTLETWIATGLNFTGEITPALNAEEEWYLQLKCNSTSASELSIVQS